MSSIHNIPEPTTAYRPVVDEPAAASPDARPMMRPIDATDAKETSRPETEIDEEVGSLTWLVMLILCGVLMRGLLLYFGLLGIDSDAASAWAEQGRNLIAHGPKALGGQLPIYPLMMAGLDAIGLPLGLLAILQATLGVLAIPAAYTVGRYLTGRSLVGLGAAALMALHPGVLAWTTAAAPGGLGSALVIIGLYLLIKHREGEPVNAWPAGIVFAFAALTAPAAWLIGLGAACFCIAQGTLKNGATSAAIVLALSIGPAAAWSAVSGNGLTQLPGTTQTETSLPRLASLTDQSLRELGTQLRFEMAPHGILTLMAEGRSDVPETRDRVADAIGDGWVALNAALLFAAAISLALMLVRHRYAAAAMLAIPLLALLVSGLPLGEPHRIALFGPLAILAFGGWCTRLDAHLTPEEREKIQHEKQLKQQEKRDAKHNQRQKKQGLYAFDKPKKKKTQKPETTSLNQTSTDVEVAPQEPEPVMSRPI